MYTPGRKNIINFRYVNSKFMPYVGILFFTSIISYAVTATNGIQAARDKHVVQSKNPF